MLDRKEDCRFRGARHDEDEDGHQHVTGGRPIEVDGQNRRNEGGRNDNGQDDVRTKTMRRLGAASNEHVESGA